MLPPSKTVTDFPPFTRRRLLQATGGALLSLSSTCVAPRWASAQDNDEQAKHWWTWRGPLGNNIAAPGTTAPTTYVKERIAWATPVPGRGHSSPIIAGDAIYLTTADKAAGTQSVLAFSRGSGMPLWNQIVHRGGVPTENHPKNTEASPSVAFDGQRLFTTFYNSSAIWLTAFSPTGEQLWQQSVGAYDPRTYKYGYAASPTIYRDTIIVAADYDGDSFLAAHDRETGKPVWKVARKGVTSFSSPIVAKIAGREQLLLSGGDAVIAYDPASGKTLWSTPALTMATCGTVVWDGDLVFASGGYPKAETACIRADGSGEVVWTNTQKCYEQSMLAHDGYVYAVTDAGVAHCWRATDGETMWRERLGGEYSSSPVLVGDTIHVFNEQGEGFAFKASADRFVKLGGGKIASDVFATPSVVGDTMYLRVGTLEGGARREYLLALK